MPVFFDRRVRCIEWRVKRTAADLPGLHCVGQVLCSAAVECLDEAEEDVQVRTPAEQAEDEPASVAVR